MPFYVPNHYSWTYIHFHHINKKPTKHKSYCFFQRRKLFGFSQGPKHMLSHQSTYPYYPSLFEPVFSGVKCVYTFPGVHWFPPHKPQGWGIGRVDCLKLQQVALQCIAILKIKLENYKIVEIASEIKYKIASEMPVPHSLGKYL